MSDVFCKIIAGDIPSTKVYEDDKAIVILDITQVTKGHALIIPKEHYESVLDCPEELLDHIMRLAQIIARAEMAAFGAKGVNILTNAKEAAGQAVPHFHVHVLPRYDEHDGLKIECPPSGIPMSDFPRLAESIKKHL